jgi:3,4-dihydroxy 2-butanone 4-phosphate synthase/GTP cyclohydrolase II
VIAPITEIILEAKNGRPFILIDSENRENEGDIVIPAQFASPEIINFMITHAKGLVCLTITADLAKQLELKPMVGENESKFGTAFMVSIGSKNGTTTGISTFDRSHTILTAIKGEKSEIVSPGHVFPLVAKSGGVLERQGHTEASVEISKLAGLNHSAVICEVINEDGTMARLPDLEKFAKKHNLKIGLIENLISHVKNHKI